jgi:hypothetical protein
VADGSRLGELHRTGARPGAPPPAPPRSFLTERGEFDRVADDPDCVRGRPLRSLRLAPPPKLLGEVGVPKGWSVGDKGRAGLGGVPLPRPLPVRSSRRGENSIPLRQAVSRPHSPNPPRGRHWPEPRSLQSAKAAFVWWLQRIHSPLRARSHVRSRALPWGAVLAIQAAFRAFRDDSGAAPLAEPWRRRGMLRSARLHCTSRSLPHRPDA